MYVFTNIYLCIGVYACAYVCVCVCVYIIYRFRHLCMYYVCIHVSGNL